MANNIIKDLNSRYRPQTWESFKGQSKIVQNLKCQALTNAGLSSSYIFHGESGTGKTTLARMFFKALSCLNIGTNGNPCLKCDACVDVHCAINSLVEVDTSNMTIKEIRELGRSSCSMLSTACKYKGILLDECHMLRKDSWNVMLKILEEAPQRAIWFLVTTEFNEIPKTIKTRCQSYEFKSCKTFEIIERLREISDDLKIDFLDNELQKITKDSKGCLRQAIHALEQRIPVKLLEKRDLLNVIR